MKTFLAVAVLCLSASAQTLTTLYTFTGGADGGTPLAGLIMDSSGNFYGTASVGGSAVLGVVFEIAGTSETVLHSFAGGTADGASPQSSLFRSSGSGMDAGTIYGTAYAGGALGLGTIFKLQPTGREVVLHNFSGGMDGASPQWAGLNFVSVNGVTDLLGSTSTGVFLLNPLHVLSVLHAFSYAPPASYDATGAGGTLIRDSAGNWDGVTSGGGANDAGTVYQVTTAGVETVLYSFTGAADGAAPQGRLTLDVLGNLYGTTSAGGANGFGTVFKLTPTGIESVIFSFGAAPDASAPTAGLAHDTHGNFYGVTATGGAYGLGALYRVSGRGVETVLWNFTGGSDGAGPMGELVRDAAGNLYGVTSAGGAGYGVVFEVTP